jgi:hypothetical protein
VLGAILAPRHPAFGKTSDDVPHFLLASHSAIFGTIARAIKMGSSDAYARKLIGDLTLHFCVPAGVDQVVRRYSRPLWNLPIAAR